MERRAGRYRATASLRVNSQEDPREKGSLMLMSAQTSGCTRQTGEGINYPEIEEFKAITGLSRFSLLRGAPRHQRGAFRNGRKLNPSTPQEKQVAVTPQMLSGLE